MSGNVAATTTSSTNSGQGSEPLSEPFVAVPVGEKELHGAARRVVAPEGSAQFNVRRSVRVASSRSQSKLPSNPPRIEFVKAPPGEKRRVGYAYQVLPSVTEEGQRA